MAHARRTYPERMLRRHARVGRGRHEDGAGGAAARKRFRRARRTTAMSCGRKICWPPTGRRASRRMDLIGIYHSHPDCDAYFSETDLKNSCPWYSFVVLSIRNGEFHHANSWLPNCENRPRRPKKKLMLLNDGQSSDSRPRCGNSPANTMPSRLPAPRWATCSTR